MATHLQCELISWERFAVLSRHLALTIHKAAYRPDVIVAIGRGGYMPARIVSDFLDVYDLTEIKIEHYRGTQKQPLARVRYSLVADIQDKRVLLVDDVSDSGDTFAVATRHLREHGVPRDIKTAVLHHKMTSNVMPDFYAEQVREWRWIIYPWSVMEDLRSFLATLSPAPTSVSAFAQYLREQQHVEIDTQALQDIFALTRP